MVNNSDNSDVSSIGEKSPIVQKSILNILKNYTLLQNDYPLAPEKLAIPYDMSNYCKKK